MKQLIQQKMSASTPLVTTLNLDQSISKLRENVYVVVKLTGELFKPNFRFELDFPANSITNSDFSVASNIQQMEKMKMKLTGRLLT